MINVKKKFYGVEGFEENCVETWATVRDGVLIQVEDSRGFVSSVVLDVDTAISFCKELRKSISIVKEVS